MCRRAWAIVLLVLLATVVARLSAQSASARLVGVVTDATGAAVGGAGVTARRVATGRERAFLADAQGVFAAEPLEPGDYEVTATFPGFAPATSRVTLLDRDVRRVQLVLTIGGLVEDVTVFGREVAGSPERLRRLPGSVEIVDRETLDANHVFTTGEALRRVAGLQIRDEEGFGLRPNIGIRGLNPTRSSKVLLLEDGIPLAFAPYGDNATYYHPPIERFERIEVFKGGAQIGYGPQTLGGLVNYITPIPPSRRAGSLALAGGSRAYANGHLSYGDTRGGVGFLLNFMRKQGAGARESTHSRLHDISAKVLGTAPGGQTWTVRASLYDEGSNVTYSGLREDEYRANPRANSFANDAMDAERFGASATHTVTPATGVALATNVYVTTFQRDWWRQSSNSAQRPNDAADPACGGMANLHTTCGNEGRLRQYETFGVEPRLRVHHRIFGMAGEAEIGLRVHAERQRRRQENGSSPIARSGLVVERSVRRNEAVAAFVQNRFLLRGWTVTPGLRVERIWFERTNALALTGAGGTGTTSLTQLIPGVGVSHSAGDRVTLFGGVHRGFAPPRTEDVITSIGGVVDLDPELSWNYEVGVRSRPARGVSVDGTWFRMDYENQIVPASLAGGLGAGLTNGGATLHAGLEASARVDSAAMFGSAHNVSLRLAHTYVPVARFEGVRFSGVSGFGSRSVSGNRLPYSAEHVVSLGMGYAHPAGVELLAEVAHTGAQFADDLNTVAPTPDGQRGVIPASAVWNTTLNYRMRVATIFVSAKNVFDRTFIVDRSRGILPSSPRLVHAGLTVRFQ